MIGFIALIGLLIALSPAFESTVSRIIFFLCYVLLAFLILTSAIVIVKKKGIKARRLYPFNFKKLDLNLVDFDRLGFDREEKIDFGLLLNRRKVQNKINFKEDSKSKSQVNYRKLFSLFHVIIENGLEDIINVHKRVFIEMLNDSFLMNGDKLQAKTMDSSLSTWKGELKDSKSSANKYIKDYKIIFSLKDN
ncbi:MAG: hypothetical protein AB8B59_05215 [Maribacter sp.]